MEKNQGQDEQKVEVKEAVSEKIENKKQDKIVKQEKNKKAKEKKSLAREVMEWILSFFVAFVAAVIIKYFIFTPTLVKQESMTPTILDGERVLINKLVKTFNIEYKRGDIITFEKPLGPDDNMTGKADYNKVEGFREFFMHEVLEADKISYIKRIIGLEGDHVYIENGDVYLNGQKLEEKYLPEETETPRTGEFYDIVVPKGYVFAMGDNRENSTDCRKFGCIPLEEIDGRVTYRIWPLEKFGKIDK